MSFLWGAATSSYQIEGAFAEDGRGTSIWDTFSRTPGKVRDAENGDVACDHYHRYADDVRLMAGLGLQAYRFSVAWPRIVPERGVVNQRGLDFYRRLVDTLLERGITPWPTLYHWDLPQYLEDAGGWPNRDTAYRFAEYADIVHTALRDRVANWTTLNEPWCSGLLGYAGGEHAPGRQEPSEAVKAVHHLLLGHGLAIPLLSGNIGITLNMSHVTPATASEADVDAARRIDGIQNRLFIDPVLLGSYPEDVVGDLAPHSDFSHVLDGDLQIISRKIDMLGINYYSPALVAAGEPAPSGSTPWIGAEHVRWVDGGRKRTTMNWEIDENGLLELLQRVHKDYPAIDLYITENGAAFADELSADGAVHDPDRIDYLERHINACAEATRRGVPLKGYFAWSLLDNFEWAHGYGQRFGIVHVDFDTQQRTPKDSALWYAARIREGGLE
ncbi:GH1 family beta-glucosidase [Nonomuraea sp. NEAU-A123]|uniref:GH1 family beta-glucosidase n=1 Tax=Nonomuraea sp. NEAU-A123 TaxID=2839649 RepID=UPI001BE45523|nr:GH1 family beta-glucosidase [Nonomuraea sp. NEAU-A123]MBT2229225.1 beta-glucosidase [Nonomuraea sp. NEAU-A123]